MLFLGILAALAAIIFAGLYFSIRFSLKSAGEELKRVNDSDSSRRLRISAPDRQLELLIKEVNRVLDNAQLSEIAHRRAEKERRDEIANISHDLRTPLTSIIGYMQLMGQDGCSEEERKEYLSVAGSRAKALQSLLSGFYDLSRLEADGYPLAPEPMQPGAMLYQLAADYYGEFLSAGMEPELRFSETLPIIYADRGALTRVFSNLFSNAIKHGGTKLWIDVRQETGFLYITFKNEAQGLTEEDCTRLFDRFFTADRMRTGQNTGLGLAIVRALCEKMGGGVEANLEGKNLCITTKWLTRR